MAYMPDFVEEAPAIINIQNVPADGWAQTPETRPHS
jgi:hypothetical protein